MTHRTRWTLFLITIGTILGCAFFVITVFYMARKDIDAHLRSQKWRLPSTIYADAPLLYEGMPMKQSELVEHFNEIFYHKSPNTSLKTAEYTVLENGVLFKKRRLPDEENTVPVLIRFNDSAIKEIKNFQSGEDLNVYELEPVAIKDLFGEEWEKRTIVHYNEIPDHLIKAVLAIEDRRFYEHEGIDLQAISRAVWRNIRNQKLAEGASTITQQLVKNFYLTPEKSFKRKVSEMFMAMALEKKLSKQQILELYLNEVYFGQRGGTSINGVGEASRLYFQKDVQHITVPEAALLAGIIRAPNSYNPYRHPGEAKQRRDVVLKTMQMIGQITEQQYQMYAKVPVVVKTPDTKTNLAPYFGDVVKNQLLRTFDEKTIYTGNLQIFTTLDLKMQKAAERALAEGLNRIDKIRFKKVQKPVQGCLIAIEPQTGYIRAFVGGRSYSKSQFDRVSQASRQPGSVFKPVVYATALEKAFHSEEYFTPATLVRDEPWVLRFSNQVWAPKNYDGQYHGIVTLRKALAESMNIATARLAQSVGLDEVTELGKRLGFVNVKPYPSVALGAFEVSPWHVASAFSVFANGGLRTELRAIKKISDGQGKTLERQKIKVDRILNPQTAYIMTDMMRSVIQHGTAASVRRSGFTRPAAGKTGTTDEYRDAWFVGYTPDLLCVVWTGYDDNIPVKMTGAQAALPIWVDFMKAVHEGKPVRDFVSPKGLVLREIDPTTGKLATAACPRSVTEIFIQGTEPENYCRHSVYYAENDREWQSNEQRFEPQSRPPHIADRADRHSGDRDEDGEREPKKKKKKGFWKKFGSALKGIFD